MKIKTRKPIAICMHESIYSFSSLNVARPSKQTNILKSSQKQTQTKPACSNDWEQPFKCNVEVLFIMKVVVRNNVEVKVIR